MIRIAVALFLLTVIQSSLAQTSNQLKALFSNLECIPKTGFESKVQPCYDFITKDIIPPDQCLRRKNRHCCLHDCACIMRGAGYETPAIPIKFSLPRPKIKSVKDIELLKGCTPEGKSSNSVSTTKKPISRRVSTKKPTGPRRPLTTKKTSTKKPTPSKRPAATRKSLTKKPTPSKRPAATRKPLPTRKPTPSKRPAVTKKPGLTKKPPRTRKPTATKKPVASKKPGKPSAAKRPGVIRKPVRTTRKPVRTTKKPLRTSRKPLRTTKKPLRATRKPGRVTKKPAKPTKKKPVKTTKRPWVRTTRKPGRRTTARPRRTTKKPCAANTKAFSFGFFSSFASILQGFGFDADVEPNC